MKKIQEQINKIKKTITNQNITNTSMSTYGKLKEIEHSLYRYDQLSKAGLKEDAKAEKIKAYEGKEVWFGLRPENIQSHSEHTEDKENFVRADVYVVEQMGNEVFVYFAVGQHQFIARLGSDVNVKSGEKHELWFDMNECHIFDTETEENITL